MLTVDIDEFVLELDEGTLKHVGASNKSATIKLYDVERTDLREFGDRVKLACEDDGGNEVEVALEPDQVRELARAAERMASDGALD
jgi:hypothetical protein